MAEDDEEEGVPVPVIMFGVGLVAIVLGLGLALMECQAGYAGDESHDPRGGDSIQPDG